MSKITLLAFLAVMVLFTIIQLGNIYPGVWESSMVAVLAPVTSFFLQFCYSPGNIFQKWIPFLQKWFRDNHKNPLGFLASPLGLCMYCQNIWITISIFAFIQPRVEDLTWWMVLPVISFSHLFISIIDKTLWD